MVSVSGSAFQEDILFAFGGGDSRITIAVLDGPVDRTHDCFRGARLTPVDTAAQANAADGIATAHGTHVASLIFGQPCSSVEGVAPLCRGLIIPIFGDDRPFCTQRELARAMLLAVEHGAHVINISGVCFIPARESDPVLAEAIDRCQRHNVLIVAAAGESCEHLHQATAASAVLAVGAIDQAGRPLTTGARYRGSHGSLLIPGSEVMGAALEGRVTNRSGADYAAALASGVVGLMLSTQLRNGLPANPQAVREALLKSATPRTASRGSEPHVLLTGREQIEASLDRILGPGGRTRGTAIFPLSPSGMTTSGLDHRD